MTIICKKCDLYRLSKVNCLSGVGPLSAQLVLVGEAPGVEEELYQTPFVGPSGKLLTRVLKELGIDRSEVFIDNVVKCRPSAGGQKNRTPTDEEIEACKTYLEETLSKLTNKKVIVALGTIALKFFAGVKNVSITTRRGREFFSEKYNCYIVPTFHPSFVLRSPRYESVFIGDLRKAVSLLTKSKEERDSLDELYKKFKLVRSLEELQELEKKILEAKYVAIDVETTSLEFWKSKLISIAFCFDESSAYCIDLRVLPEDKVRDFLQRTLEREDIYVIGHNIKFDYVQLKAFGVRIRNLFFDTMIAYHLIDENSTDKSLKSLAWTFTEYGGYEKVIEDFDLDDESEIPVEKLYLYNCGDAYITYLIWKKLEPVLKEQKLMRLFKQILMPACRVLGDTEYFGVGYDVERAQKLREECLKRMESATKKIKEVTGKDINVNSALQLRELLFKDLKLDVIEKTGAGQPSTSESTIRVLAEKYKEGKAKVVLDAIIEYRKASKIISTYIDGLIKKLDPNGRLHPDFQMTGTVTGRLSVHNPGLHNVTHDSTIRNLFVARKGWRIVEADLRQAELRIFLNLIGQYDFVDLLKQGHDPYKELASRIYKIPLEEVDDNKREMAKGLTLGMMYGMGPRSIAETLNLPYEEGLKIYNSFFQTFPRALEWMRSTVETARRTKQVRNLFGRIRHITGIDSEDEYLRAEAERQAINSPVQSSASDFTLLLIVRVDRRLREANMLSHLVLTIHDSVIFESPENEVEALKKIIQEELERPVEGLVIPMAVKFIVSERWEVG